MVADQYSDKEEYYFHSQRKEMVPFIPNDVQTLLEVGCGSGSFASHLKALRKIVVTGIEPQRSAFEQASTVLDTVLHLDVDSGITELKGQQFDCIVFNDVLEHLVDPWDALTKVRELLAPGGSVVASIPNIRYMPVLKEFVLRGNWRYQRDGVMDRTHLRFFTERSIAEMFDTSGYEISECQGINGIQFPWKYSLLNRLTGRRLEDTQYQQFACVAKSKGSRGITLKSGRV